ncbi:MAG: YciI family protein [Thermomicrobiales bacterium]
MSHEGGTELARFVALLTFGDQERRLEVRPRHREYLAALYEQGKLLESGPFADDEGALIIYDAANDAEVQALIAEDPYTKAGVIAHLDVRQWRRVIPPD